MELEKVIVGNDGDYETVDFIGVGGKSSKASLPPLPAEANGDGEEADAPPVPARRRTDASNEDTYAEAGPGTGGPQSRPSVRKRMSQDADVASDVPEVPGRERLPEPSDAPATDRAPMAPPKKEKKVPEVADLMTLRVHIPSLATITTMMFPSTHLVYDVVLRLKAEIKELSFIEGDSKHFQLFIAAETFKDCAWLNPKKTLKELRLATGVLIEFKSAVRDQKIKLMDGRVTVFPIDDSFSVTDLIKSFCKNIGIKNPADYALCIDIEDDKIDTLDSKFDTFWLNDYQTLREQNIDTDNVIAFRRRFYNDNRNCSKDDHRAINRVFGEISEAIISSRLPVVQVEASTCGAVIAQITLGDKGHSSKIDFKQFLPKEFQSKSCEKDVVERYNRLQGLNEKMAKYRFIVEAKGLKHYGFKFFKVIEREGKKDKEKTVYFGVNPDVVVRVNATSKEVISRWPLSKVVRFAASASDFSMDFGSWAHKLYNCITNEADQIASVVNTYYKSIQKCRYAFEELKEVEILFTTPWSVEKLEPDHNPVPKGPFGRDAKLATPKPPDPKKKPGYDEFAEVYKTAINEMQTAESMAQFSSDQVQVPEDLEAVKENAFHVAEVVALTAARIAQLLSGDLDTKKFGALKQLGVTFSIQAPDLVLQMRILAKNEQIYGRNVTKYVKPAIAVAKTSIKFLKSALPDSKIDFISRQRAAKDLIEGCIFCQQELRTEMNSAGVSYKLMLLQATKEVSAVVLDVIKEAGKICLECPSTVQQTELNRRAALLVDLAAQHFILIQALASFESTEVKTFIASLEPDLKKALNDVEASCREFTEPEEMADLQAAVLEVLEAMDDFNETLEGNPAEQDPINATVKIILKMCKQIMKDPSNIIGEAQSLVDSLSSLVETLREEEDEDEEETKFEDIIEELIKVQPEISALSREYVCCLDDDQLKVEFQQQIDRAKEQLVAIQSLQNPIYAAASKKDPIYVRA